MLKYPVIPFVRESGAQEMRTTYLGEVPATDADQSYFEKQVAYFKEIAGKFYAAFQSLLDRSSHPALATNPELKAEFDALSQRGGTIRGTLESITNKIDAAVNWFRGTGAAEATLNAYENGQLGFLPLVALIPIAAIAASGAVITKYVSDVYLFNRKLEEAQTLLARGLTPAETSAILEANVGTALTLPGGTAGKVIVFGAVAFVLWRMLKR